MLKRRPYPSSSNHIRIALFEIRLGDIEYTLRQHHRGLLIDREPRMQRRVRPSLGSDLAPGYGSVFGVKMECHDAANALTCETRRVP